MDERSGHPQQHHGPIYGQPDTIAPWPNAPIHVVPEAGVHGGFVLPGAAAGQPALSAHGGTIGVAPGTAQTHSQAPFGVPMPLLQQQSMPMQMPPGVHPAHPHVAGAVPGHAPHHPGTPQSQPPAEPSQAWAFPTPFGMQLVQSGAAPGPAAAAAPAPPAAVRSGGGTVTMGRRVRWEVIVPVVAVACLVGVVALVAVNFDRMTGRETASKAASGSGVSKVAAGDTAATVADAATAMDAGRYDQAAKLLLPLLDEATPDTAAVKLMAKVDFADARNTALLTRLAAQRRARKWTAALGTVDQIATLRPLSPDLVRMRTQLRRTVRVTGTASKARALIAAGRLTAAANLLDGTLQTTPDPALQALRDGIERGRQRPSTTAASSGDAGPSTTPSTSGGGGGGAVRPITSPPAAGGRPPAGSSTGARPPANVGAGVMPPRPDLPNPVSSTPSVAPPATPENGGAEHPAGAEHPG